MLQTSQANAASAISGKEHGRAVVWAMTIDPYYDAKVRHDMSEGWHDRTHWTL